MTGVMSTYFDYNSPVVGAEDEWLYENTGWKGGVQHFAVWDCELSAAEMLVVGRL
jgi:hypothetical protein